MLAPAIKNAGVPRSVHITCRDACFFAAVPEVAAKCGEFGQSWALAGVYTAATDGFEHYHCGEQTWVHHGEM